MEGEASGQIEDMLKIVWMLFNLYADLLYNDSTVTKSTLPIYYYHLRRNTSQMNGQKYKEFNLKQL